MADLQRTVYPHSGHPSAAGRAQDRVSSPAKDRRSANCATQPAAAAAVAADDDDDDDDVQLVSGSRDVIELIETTSKMAQQVSSERETVAASGKSSVSLCLTLGLSLRRGSSYRRTRRPPPP